MTTDRPATFEARDMREVVGFSMAKEAARRVYEACQKAGAKVGQATVRQVIAGILYSGLKLTASKPDARQLAKAWADNVIGLCRGAQMQLSKADERNIRTWVTGGLLEPAH